MYDLMLKGGRVVDPAQGLDAVCDVAFRDGRVAAVGPNLGPAATTRDMSGKIVAPGLIDLHTHVYWGGTSIGVDPDAYAKRAGCTTLIDAGTAGPGNLPGFRKHIVERSDVRILPFMNISYPGIFAFGSYVMVGECEDLRMLSPRACRDIGREHKDLIVGIKVRVGKGASGTSGLAPLDMALEVSDHLGIPVMAHLDHPPPYRSEVMPRLRRGDILTHCYRPFPNAPITGDGRVQDDVHAARERGVIFDIGHGAGSFGYETALAMLGHGFLPDVISSDVHVLSENGPAFDQLVTMSKFLAIGMSLVDVIRASTINPALAVRKTDRGTLTPGTLGDASVLEIEKGRFTFADVLGETREGTEHLRCRGIVLGGKWWRD
jgi:dihydroorotase